MQKKRLTLCLKADLRCRLEKMKKMKIKMKMKAAWERMRSEGRRCRLERCSRSMCC